MQRPYCADMVSFYISKQQRKVDIAIVEVMQMDNVRLYPIQAFQENPGIYYGEHSVEAGQFPQQNMDISSHTRADINMIFKLLRPHRTSVRTCRIDAVSFLSCHFGNPQHDISRASIITRVDHYDIHTVLSPASHSILKYFFLINSLTYSGVAL